MLKGEDIDVGGKTLTLRFTQTGIMQAEKILEADLRSALILRRGPLVVYTAAAAALQHMGPKSMTPTRLAAAVQKEPGKYSELEAKVMKAAKHAYREMGVIDEDDDPSGEDDAGEATQPSPSSAAAGDGESTPGSPSD